MPDCLQIDSDKPEKDDNFISLLTGHQDVLLSFIRGSIGDLSTAKDILQEVNLILWKKSSQFKLGTNFKAWALKIAKFQILANYRDHQRSKLVFDDELLDQLALAAEQEDADWQDESRLKALELCLQKLPKEQRQLLDSRYHDGHSIKDLSVSLNSSASRLKMILLRARKNLRDCILAHREQMAFDARRGVQR
jgi:RNA polymerase sigma-70 factor (ECF subfamily)